MKMREGSLYKNQHATQRAEILSGEERPMIFFSSKRHKYKQAQLLQLLEFHYPKPAKVSCCLRIKHA